MERPLLVYTTFPDAEMALAVGEALVRLRLAACVNVLPGMRSVYAWKGAVERADEVVALIKSREALAEPLRRGDPPVIGRVSGGRLLLDVRTMTDEEVPWVARALSR